MKSIPIFDCLTHPTINGKWGVNGKPSQCSIDSFGKEMKRNNVKWAFAVGMEGIGDYEEEKYLKTIKQSNLNLFPIAYFNYPKISGKKNIFLWVDKIKKMGFAGVKIHPRFSDLSLKDKNVIELVNRCGAENLTVLLCTYFYSSGKNSYSNNVDSLIEFLKNIGNNKVVLLHSGSVRLLETIEIARAYDNVLLDLSFTLNKYQGSSLDLDIAFAFKNFDRRICVGSDFPSFSLFALRKRFEVFSTCISPEQKENIAYKNIFKFLNLPGIEAK